MTRLTFCRFCSLISLVLLLTTGVAFEAALGATVDQEVFELAKNQNLLKLKVFLTHQPGHQIALAEKQVFQPEFDRLSQQVRELIQPFKISKDIIPQPIRERLKDINRKRDALLDEMRRAIYARIKPQIQPQQDRVKRFVTDILKGHVYAQVSFVNVLGVEIPSSALTQLANHPDVARISVDHEGQPELDDTAEAIGADQFWYYGYTGDGTWDVAVVDSGVSLYHPALSAHRESGDPYISTMSNRPDQNHPDDDYGHGTAVAGIIASTDATYKGIAYGIDKIIICKVMTGGYNPVETEVWEAVDWALDASKPPYSYAHETAEIINFSAGFDTVDKYHGYSDSAKFFDAVVDDLHVMVVTSAGNYGDNIEKGNITSPGDMFNGLTVANMDNRNTPQRSDDVAADSSSVGPAGGRKKPDVIAPGTYITTTRRDWFQGFPKFGTGTNGNGGYITFSGTSFAAPHVTGAIALLYDYLSTWPKTLKAVLINTADDWGEQGWDGKHGWGYINLQAALTHWFYDEVGLNPAGSNFDRYYWSCSIDPGEKITAVWNREVDYNYPEPPTVHDLDNIDLFLYDYTGGVKGSLLASSTSTVDNVEQVVYNGTTSKQVLVEVRNMTPNSDAYVSVAFPSPFSRKGYGPYAPPRPVSHQNEPIRNELGQNFPNPFNAETWIPYAIEKEAVVSVQIFDTNGRLVRKLDIGKKPAGCYFSKERAIHWDGRNELGERVPSGVYFYYLTAGEFAATRKMVVLE